MVSYSEWILKLLACHLMHYTMLKITKPLEYIITQHKKERKTVHTHTNNNKKTKRRRRKKQKNHPQLNNERNERNPNRKINTYAPQPYEARRARDERNTAE